MSAEAAALTRSFRVGNRTCTWTIQQPHRGALAHSVVEWEPDVPRRLTGQQLRQYRRGRDAVMREVAALIGGRVLVVEV